jgi:alpha-glucosidase
MRKLLLLLAGLGLFLAALPDRASDEEVQALPDGVAMKVGNDQVELRVASAHAFRLHIFDPGFSTPGRSIYLSSAIPAPAPFTVAHDGDIVGVKTSFGELRLDPKNKAWSMNDAGGKSLTDWAHWEFGDDKTASDHLGLSTTRYAAAPAGTGSSPRYYSSGCLPHRGDLIETDSDSNIGNGVVSLPQFWSTDGYGALMLGARDDFPSGWHANNQGGMLFVCHGPDIDLYLAPAPTLAAWLHDQAELTGFAPVPPRWALGYLQSRWGWKDKAYIDETLAHFRKDRLPVDAFIFDFEWYTKTADYQVPADGTADFVDFGWNPVLFPDPAAQLRGFAENGLHMVGIRKPRLGNSANIALARSKGWIVPTDSPDPATRRNLDFSNADCRTWYEDNLRKFDEAGVAGFWNDEGELRFDEYMYWNLAEFDLLHQVRPGARYWSINRAFAPGLQRFGAATWSGDIGSDWDTLKRTPGDLLSYSLSGMPYAGCDIGGFSGEATPELLARWMEAGVFFPVMRSHSAIDRTPRFPWLYGPDAENAIRAALDLRYRLIPFYNSLAHENHRTGMPLMRALVLEFPDDAKVFNLSDEWLMGPGLLAAPLLQEGGKRTVYLPADRWFTFGTNQATSGPQTGGVTAKLEEVPLYVRAGTILPLGPVVQDAEEVSTAPLEVQIYPGKDAAFDFAEDDGTTLAYEKGDERVTHFTWDDATRTLSWKTEGRYAGANCFSSINAVLFAPEGKGRKQADLGGSGSLKFPANAGVD